MTVQETREALVRSRMLSPELVGDYAAGWTDGGGADEDGGAFLDWLVEQQAISDFQAQAILAGLDGPLRLGPYRVDDQITAGRLGTLVRGVHEEFHQPVSLKIYPAADRQTAEQTRQISQEARVAVQVDHPNLLRVFHIGRAGDVVFVAAEELRGETLAARLLRDGSLPVEEAGRLMLDVARGLAHAHSRGIVLRDLQPAALWVTDDGRAKIIEFGASLDSLSALDDESDAVTDPMQNAELYGHYDYLSPEQGTDPASADARSDIYALGCVFFHCLTGSVLYPDINPVRKMLRHARAAVPSARDLNGEVPVEIADILGTMLTKEPDHRYQTMDDVAWALERALAFREAQAMAVAEIDPEFLEWANSHAELEISEPAHTAVAQPEFIDFLGLMGAQDYSEADFTRTPVESEQETAAALKKLRAKYRLDDDGHIRSIDFEQTRVNDGRLALVASLPRLQNLVLRATRITDGGLKHLSHTDALKWLNLNKTAVTDAGLKHLYGLTHLEFLFLADTRTTDEGLQNLREALPHCDVRT